MLGAVGQAYKKAAKKLPGKVPGVATARGWASDRRKKGAERRQAAFGRGMRKTFGRIPGVGGAITGETALDKIERKNKLTKTFDGMGLSRDQKRAYAQGKLDWSSLSSEKKALLRRFEREGGNKNNAIDSLAASGDLNEDTAKAAKTYLQKNGDWESALKTSNLHQMRDGGQFDLSTLSAAQLGKMDKKDIRNGRFSAPAASFGSYIGGDKSLTPEYKAAIADGLGADGHTRQKQDITNSMKPKQSPPPNTNGGGI